MTVIFDFGDFNSEGICEAICGQWIKKSRMNVRYGKDARGVRSLDELGTQAFLQRIWDEADDNEHISRNNLLGKPFKTNKLEVHGFGGTLNPESVARELTMGYNRYILLGMNFYNGEGHALASKRMLTPDGLQFLDPNASCWAYDSSFEMYNHIRNHIQATLGQDAVKSAEIFMFRP
jgi:hypothetical protein